MMTINGTICYKKLKLKKEVKIKSKKEGNKEAS